MIKNHSQKSRYALKSILLFVMFCCAFPCCSETQARVEKQQQYDVGVLALRGYYHAANAWQPTMDWLTKQIPNAKFVLHTYSFDELEQAFNNNKLDFLLTSPGQATTFARQSPLNWLATQKTAHDENSSKALGSTVIVRHDSPLQSIEDIDKTHIGAVSEKAFGGFLALRYELEQTDYFNSSFFKHLEFRGFPTDALIRSVFYKELEVAVVPACTLETMAKEGLIDINEFRVLGRQNHDGFRCEVSTALYPNWTFAKTSRASIDIGKRVAQALMAMPSDSLAAQKANNIGWTMPESKIDIDNVYKYFEIHPLQNTLKETIESWLHKHPYLAILIIVVLFSSNIYFFWLEWRFKRNQHTLRTTLEDLRQKSSMLEHAQRIMIVGELGSSLAHEINQPLTAIKNYSQGAKVRFEQNKTNEELLPVLNKIQQQVTVASEIIQRLRDLINKKEINKRKFKLEELIHETVKLVEYGFKQENIECNLVCFGNARNVSADYTGLQQVLLNLLNNAKEACMMAEPSSTPLLVEIELIYTAEAIQLVVTDNGVGIEDENIELVQAFYTTKKNGLGLGLAICRDVVESHGGSIKFHSAEPCGCRVVVILPY